MSLPKAHIHGFFFFLVGVACRILFPDQGLNPHPLQWEHRAFNHWTTRKVPYMAFFEFYFLNLNVANQPNANISTISTVCYLTAWFHCGEDSS